jgi:HEAT repeat protein
MYRFLAVGMFCTLLTATSGCSHEEPDFLAGGREVESWITALHDSNPLVRREAVMKLGNVGDADPAAAEGLTEALRDSDVQVRRAAVFAVVKLEEPGEAITSQLEIMRRNDSEPGIREVAGKALKKLNRAD